MNSIIAIGFDLINTLVTVGPNTLEVALRRMADSLSQDGFTINGEPFQQAYREAVLKFIEKTRHDGRESHNRFWISNALLSQGYDIPPEDERIARAVESYFSIFYESCRLIPGTLGMLETLAERYSLGLLSNFTHASAAKEISSRVGLGHFFKVVLISGDLGFRKPHPIVFQMLIEGLGVEQSQTLYVGDDPEPDIIGAKQAGLVPVWSTYVRDHRLKISPLLVPGELKEPDFIVPRISTWQDLLSFLSKDGNK